MSEIFKNQIQQYCSPEIKRYSVWVYAGKDVIHVYHEQKPNTQQIWFDFYTFSNFYWKMMEKECVIKINTHNFYDFSKIKIFMIKYLLCNTNMECSFIQRDEYGCLTNKSFESIFLIHPRILRVLFDKMDVFPKSLSKKEEKEFEKQCSQLFGKGKAVSDPNQWIVMYCNLISFWDKFGMNYHDIMKLPNETFVYLKRIMNLDNEYKNKNISSPQKSTNKKGVKF